jgi:hypothetical protein
MDKDALAGSHLMEFNIEKAAGVFGADSFF